MEHWKSLPEPLRTALDPRPWEPPAHPLRESLSEDDPLSAVVRAHLEGGPVAAALVGPAGSGRSSRLGVLARHLGGVRRVTRITAERRLRSDADVAALLARFAGSEPAGLASDTTRRWLEEGPPSAVLVDDADRLFPRAVGADGPARMLLAALLQARERHLFVFVFRDWSWRRLDYRVGASDCFNHVVEVGYPGDETFEAILGARMEIAGPVVSWPEEVASNPAAVPSEEAPTQAERFIERLRERSRGNLRLALLLWLVAVRADEGSDLWVFDAPRAVDLDVLKRLDESRRFSLVELIAHGGLTVAEHSELFQTSAADSLLILEGLGSQRLVLREFGRVGPERYDVDPAFYGPVCGALEAMHLLY